jgi:DNA polymerase I
MGNETQLPENIVNVSAVNGRMGEKALAIQYYDANRIKKIKIIDNFKPYFYVPLDAKIPIDISNIVFPDGDKDYTSYKGKKLKRIALRRMSKEEFLRARDKFDETYEDDVLYHQRFMIDNNVTFSKDQRIMYIDIETYYSVDEINAPEPIMCLTAYDSFDKKYYVFVWHSELQMKVERNDNVNTYYFNNEIAMMNKFLDFLDYIKPDIYTGWFSDRFDFPYIINRCKKLNLNYNKMSPLRNVYIVNEGDLENYQVHIVGSNILDCRAIYKKMAIYGKPPNYRLDTVAKYALKTETKMQRPDFDKVWTKERIKELLDYNIQDVKVTMMINEKVGLINYFLRVQQEIPISLEDIFMTSRVVDNYILHTYHDKFIFPSKRNRERVEIGGGYVMTPPAKILKDVIAFDFKAMYTTIYITFNISPELIVDNDDANVNKDNNVIVDIVQEEQESKANARVCYDMTRGIGLIPSILSTLLERRIQMQKERDEYVPGTPEYKARDDAQGTYKEILNSFFGTMGYSNFRLFEPRVSNTITFIGREMSKFAIVEIEKMGYKVLYADTDSCFFQLPTGLSDIEKVVVGNDIRNKVNDKLAKEFIEKFTNHKLPFERCNLEIEFENMYSNIVFAGVKKRYAGILTIKKGLFSPNEFKCMGFELVRKDTPVIIRETLETVFKLKLKGKNEEVEKVIEETRNKIANMKNVIELAIPRPINKHLEEYTKSNPQHIRAARYSEEHLGLEWHRGESGYMLYIKCDQSYTKPRTDVVLIKEDTVLPTGMFVDVDRLVLNYLYSPLEFFADISDVKPIIFRESGQKSLGEYVKDNV